MGNGQTDEMLVKSQYIYKATTGYDEMGKPTMRIGKS